MTGPEQNLLDHLEKLLGPGAVVPAEQAAGRPIAPQGAPMEATPILRPASTTEASTILRLCHEAGQSLICLGGASGLAQGTQRVTGSEWYLSLERMRGVEIDRLSRIAVLEAGAVLQVVQEAAHAAGLLFPVDLGARGSATIGGLISTNAGGERVFRYGMMREQVLGLEVVLADGTVLDLMGEVIKNNAGYDLKHLFIGSEGTLGVVTRAVVRLRPAPLSTETAFLALATMPQVIQVLEQLESRLGGTLSAFELMWPEFMATQVAPRGPHRPPLQLGDNYFVLAEAEGGDPASDHDRFEAVLAELLNEGVILDAAIAQTVADRVAYWTIRNDVMGLLSKWWPLIMFDVSVPVRRMEDFISRARTQVAAAAPGATAIAFGHVADNNLHLGVHHTDLSPESRARISQAVYALVQEARGSISAEHGIGLEKRDYLRYTRGEDAIRMMRLLKTQLDPRNILNPGKVI